MQAIATMINRSVIRNQEVQNHATIAIGRGGQLKKGETCSGTFGVWFQPLSGASDIDPLLMKQRLYLSMVCLP